jgi:hypothetical protein
MDEPRLFNVLLVREAFSQAQPLSSMKEPRLFNVLLVREAFSQAQPLSSMNEPRLFAAVAVSVLEAPPAKPVHSLTTFTHQLRWYTGCHTLRRASCGGVQYVFTHQLHSLWYTGCHTLRRAGHGPRPRPGSAARRDRECS